MRIIQLLAIASLAAPAVALAQAVPDINAPKRAAQKAADSSNARLASQTGQAVPQRKGTSTPAPAPTSGPATGNAAAGQPQGGATPGAPVAPPGVAPVTREVYSYESDGRRDPFFSLILTEDLRPLISDLKLMGILYDATGRRSVAIMRDLQTNQQYRVGPGQTIGRMRVAQIRPRTVLFTIDEFGTSRTDSLFLADTTMRIR